MDNRLAADMMHPPSTANNSMSASIEWNALTIIAVTAALLISILTIIGSILVILAVKKFKRLQISSNYILVNLAMADISVATFIPPTLFAELIGPRVKSIDICILPYSFITLGCGVSLWSLGIVAYDRYAALVKPLKYCQHITTKRIMYVSASVWLYVFVIVTTSSSLAYALNERTGLHWHCEFTRHHEYIIMFQVAVLFVPVFLLMMVCYCRVMLVARHHARAITAIQLSVFPNALNKNFHMFKGAKYSRTLLIILGCFFLTWVVFIVTLPIEMFCDICGKTIIPLYRCSCFLIFTNSCLNPWIYAYRNQDFKKAFRRLCHTCLCIKKQPRAATVGQDGDRNSRYSNALSRTNSMVGGLQHLHVLYDNADILPMAEERKICKQASTPKLILHEIAHPNQSE